MKPGHSYFITGTDTGVGKTVVTAAVTTLLRLRGENAVPMKPVQTGCTNENGVLLSDDIQTVLRLTGLEPHDIPLDTCSPLRFSTPCSPHLAAERDHTEFQNEFVFNAFRTLQNEFDSVIVEGAGGIMVPLTASYFMIDLVEEMNIPVIIAARAGLGTINHSLLTIAALQARKIPIAGIVFSHTEPGLSDWMVQDSISTIEKKSGVSIIGELPYIKEFDSIEVNEFSAICLKYLKLL